MAFRRSIVLYYSRHGGIERRNKGTLYDSDDETTGCRLVGLGVQLGWTIAFVWEEMAMRIGYVAIILRGLFLGTFSGSVGYYETQEYPRTLEVFLLYWKLFVFMVSTKKPPEARTRIVIVYYKLLFLASSEWNVCLRALRDNGDPTR